MVLPNKIVVLLGALLAVVEALIAYFHPGGWWTPGLSAAVIILGGFGIQQLSPAAIVAKIPAHVASVVVSVLTALEVFQQDGLSMPTAVHMAIGAAFAVAAALGITVTGVAVSRAASRSIH